ncbi:MAG: hypothetical protein AVDCRST_MAG59-2860 [uncultured Thermomicrobiales bacterium]|uniref:Uncharacterized protein n=1 Tax=uncultured Thermomicrobiales bacterium TaxID=1645740 RepID=A0A6J4UYI5_9BACT|nr:MAG: hypothetical protein AVDCRST_MAG59-2860 [uncultured Thermomicrobiales bacterium]
MVGIGRAGSETGARPVTGTGFGETVGIRRGSRDGVVRGRTRDR